MPIVGSHSHVYTPMYITNWIICNIHVFVAVADLGFPIGGHAPIRGERGPPTLALFGENVCKNERIGSHRGWHVPGMPTPRSANA